MNAKKVNYNGLIISGGFLGAILGIVAVLIMIKSAENEESTPHLNTKKGVQLGLRVVSLLRLFQR